MEVILMSLWDRISQSGQVSLFDLVGVQVREEDQIWLAWYN